MPSGVVHSKISLAMIAVGSPLIIMSDAIPVEAKAPMIGGLCFGWWLSPDIDLATQTHEEKRAKKIPIFGKMWVMFWASYGELFNHRGVSHWYGVGTLTRLFWIVRLPLVGIALLWLLQLSGVLEVTLLIEPQPLAMDWFVPFMVGWMAQDSAHITADLLVSEHRQKKKRRK